MCLLLKTHPTLPHFLTGFRRFHRLEEKVDFPIDFPRSTSVLCPKYSCYATMSAR